MARRVPPSVTGGAGFVYEDEVGAYFVSALLAGAFPSDPELGRLNRIDFQTSALGWQLDDVALVLTDDQGQEHRICASIKSGSQLVNLSADPDFVVRAWRELDGAGGPFRPEQDLVGLITSRVSQRSYDALMRIQEVVHTRGTDQLEEILPTLSDSAQTLWSSFRRPGEGSSTSPAPLVQRLRFFHLDFAGDTPRAFAQALRWCAEVLRDPGDAPKLWDRLLRITAERRRAGGTITLSSLLDEIVDFPTTEYEPHRRAWELATSLTRQHLDSTRTDVGGTHIERLDVLAKVAASDARLVVLSGPAGAGKTSVASMRSRDRGNSIWLAARNLESAVDGRLFGVELASMLASHGNEIEIVIDGLDREFGPETFSALATIVRGFGEGRLRRHRLLLTTQGQEWPRIASVLHRENADAEWDIVPVALLTDKEVLEVLHGFRAIAQLAIRSRVTSALRNLKVLDTIVRAGAESSRLASVSDESGAARVFWDELVRGGHQRASRAALAMRIAERTADELQTEVSFADIGDVEQLDDLERDGVLETAASRVRFAHELYGDWARLEILRSQPGPARYLEQRLESPVWHRAVRLYALDLLANGIEAWTEELNRLGPNAGILHDLFIEAPLFSADPSGLLERIWPTLTANEGVLLRRLLSRVRHTATVPNETLRSAITRENPTLAVYAAANYRLPYWPLWIELLRVLAAHKDEVVEFALPDAMRLTDSWLRETPTDWPSRQEAAQIASAGARFMVEATEESWHQDSGLERLCWRALLACAYEDPETVEELTSRLLSYRIEVPGRLLGLSQRQTRNIVERDFREVCLSPDALVPLMEARPQLAGHLIVSCLTPREATEDDMFSYHYGDFVDIDDTESREAFYTEGPFLRFLQINPSTAIPCLVQIVDAATARWFERRPEPAASTISPVDRPESVWVGSIDVTYWHRGEPFIPKVLASSLMALEKWLMLIVDELEDDPRAGEAIESCLSARSTSLLGVLVSLVCYRPSLAKGALRSLISIPELYLWDNIYKARDHSYLAWFVHDDGLAAARTEWHNLPHRRLAMQSVMLRLFLTDESEAAFFDTLRQALTVRADNEPTAGYIQSLAAMLDRVNWSEQEGVWTYRPPTELVEQDLEFESEQEEHLFWLTIQTRIRSMIADDTTTFSSDELDLAWEDLTERLAKPVPEGLQELVSHVDVECGFSALFLLKCSHWLQDHPEIRQWCRESVVGALRDQTGRTTLEPPNGTTDWGWDVFAGEALAVLWSEEPEDEELRSAVAHLIFGYRHLPIARFVSRLHEHRTEMSTDFRQVRHLILIASLRTWEDEARLRAIDDFVSGRLPAESPDWVPLAIPDASPQRTGQLGRALGIDVERLWTGWSPSDTAAAKADGADWLEHLQRNVELLVSRVARDRDHHRDEAAGTPFHHEYQLLWSLPQWILDLDDAESARTLWEPLLSLGGYAETWVETYLQAWVRAGLSTDPTQPMFVEIWEEMLAFASEEAAWQRGRGVADLWEAILGLDWLTLPQWRVAHVPVVLRLKPYFVDWCGEWLGSYDGPSRWARFLQNPAGRSLLQEGLISLAQSYPRDRRRDSERADDDIAELLVQLWAEERERLRGDPALGGAFRQLLRTLTDRQNGMALELSSTIGRI